MSFHYMIIADAAFQDFHWMCLILWCKFFGDHRRRRPKLGWPKNIWQNWHFSWPISLRKMPQFSPVSTVPMDDEAWNENHFPNTQVNNNNPIFARSMVQSIVKPVTQWSNSLMVWVRKVFWKPFLWKTKNKGKKTRRSHWPVKFVKHEQISWLEG